LIFFSGHITIFSSAYSKSSFVRTFLSSFATLIAASLAIFSRSAPTNQLVLFAIVCKSILLSSFLSLVCNFNISTLSSSVGFPIYTFLSNLQGLINAGSSISGLFVAAITIIFVSLSNQSISVRI